MAAANLIARLVAGDGATVRSYMARLPYDLRVHVVDEVREHALPAHWALFLETAPWLAEIEPRGVRERIVAALRAAGAAGLNRSQVQVALRRVPVPEIGAALDGLVDAMEVQIVRERTKGRPADRYRLAEFADINATPANLNRNPFARRHGPR